VVLHFTTEILLWAYDTGFEISSKCPMLTKTKEEKRLLKWHLKTLGRHQSTKNTVLEIHHDKKRNFFRKDYGHTETKRVNSATIMFCASVLEERLDQFLRFL